MADRFGVDAAWKRLQQQWEQTKTVWNDPVSRDVEKTWIAPLAEQEARIQRELERLAEVVQQAQRNVR